VAWAEQRDSDAQRTRLHEQHPLMRSRSEGL
jgi:hypothetical protein